MRKMNLLKRVAAVCLIQALALTGAAAGIGKAEIRAQETKPPMVADAAMYRGSVINVYEDEGKTYLQLRQEKGTNFGPAVQTVTADNNTYFNGELSDIKDGDYMEVFYGAEAGNRKLETKQAITMEKLPEAESSLFNGTVEELEKEGNGGSILLKQLDSEIRVLFRYSDSTQLYLNINNVKKGDKLNIFYNGIQTRSIPAQSNASEIRTYYDNSIYRGTIEEMTEKGGITTLTLKKAEGTPYAQSYKVNLKNTTKSSQDLSTFKKGDYVEVLYKTPKKSQTIPSAKTIEKLFETEMCIYTGTLASVEKDEKDGDRGVLVMKDSKGEEMLFHYGYLTNFVTDLSKLKEGDKLSIYHRGVMTMSLPPQGSALEVALYQK